SAHARDRCVPPRKENRAPGHFVHLSLIVPDFHALNRAVAEHLINTLTHLIHILTPDELASHELARSTKAEKSVGEHACDRGVSPNDNERCCFLFHHMRSLLHFSEPACHSLTTD